VTQGVDNSWCIWSVIEGPRHPQASYLSLDQVVSFMPIHVCSPRAIRINLPGIAQDICLNPPRPDLARGALAPVWSYGEALPWLPLTHKW
jgi:hypothetical protein